MPKPVRPWTPPRARVLLCVSAFLLAANVFDAYHTLQLLGAHVEEANPLMRRVMDRDWTYVWILKIGVPILCALPTIYVIRHPRAPTFWRRALWYALCAAAAFYAFIVLNILYIYVRVLMLA